MKHFAKNRFKTRIFHWLFKFANAIAQLPDRMTPAPFRLIQMGSAYWQSRVLYLVTELDIATHLHSGPRTIKDLASSLQVHEDHLRRTLRFMAAFGIFEFTDIDTVRNNEVSAFLDRNHKNNVRSMILMHQSTPMYEAWWKGISEGIRQGEPAFALRHGEQLFDYMAHHSDFNRLFSEAMTSVEALTGDHFARDFDWSGFQHIIDIGGSNGSKSATILHIHPTLTATVCDLPEVIDEASQNPPWAEQKSIASRISFVQGNVFGELPPSGPCDVYFLSAVLHGFSDNECVTILKNIRNRSGREDPWVVIMEMVVDDPINRTMAAFDLQMLVCTHGRERTLMQWHQIFTQSGFELIETVATSSLATLLLIRGQV